MSESRGLAVPGQGQTVPGVPTGTNIIAFEQFAGLNTKTPRVSISAAECSWLDNMMPVTDTNLRSLYGFGQDLYTAPAGRTIVYFTQFNIGNTTYFFVEFDDGSCVAVNTNTGNSTTIGASGTLTGNSFIGVASWGGQYLVFSAAKSNGYFIWDGTNLYQSGTLGPIVTITNGGLGYSTAPTVTTVGGSGSSATFTATVENGAVNQVTVTDPGTGYSLGNPVILLFDGGNGTQTAYGTATIENGVITNVTLTDGGSGYQDSNGVQEPPSVVITDGTGSGAIIVVSEMGGGQVISLKLIAGGSAYSSPSVSFSGLGTGGAADLTVESGVLTAVTVTQAGIGYTGDTSVTFFNSTGTGAAATATLNHTTGAVTAITLTSGGSGYSGQTLCVVNGPGPAAATINLMPFGISGTAIEIFESRVWIANGYATTNQNRVVFSAADDPADFDPADGAGAFPSTDSFLRVGYYALKQTNGFLYLIGDSSVNTISGVQTNSPGSGATATVVTTFNNQNSDPQLGSPWQASVQVYSRNIVMANAYGILVSYGGAVTKISEALDGFYNTVLGASADNNYPSAIATIFGTQVYMLLIPYIDPVLNQSVTGLVMWNGKKFWTQDNSSLTFVATLGTNSNYKAWGTNGTSLFPLFHTPVTNTKTIQTKLYIDPSYWTTKTAIRLSAVVQPYQMDNPLKVTIDNENGSTAQVLMSATGSSPDFLGSPEPVGQSGRCIGMTITCNASDFSLLSISLLTQIETANT